MILLASGSRNYGGFFDFDAKSARLIEVNQLLEDPQLWNDPKRAQEMGREKKSLEVVVEALEAQRKFWKYVGICLIVLLALYVIAIALAIMLPALKVLSQR